MTDVFTAEKRSDVMSRIRSEDTKPEILVRKLLFASGFRFRLHDRRFPGRPDVVLKKWKTVILVNGCFWHSHSGCRFASKPSSHEGYWTEKLRRNRERDAENQRKLLEDGWRVLIVWRLS